MSSILITLTLLLTTVPQHAPSQLTAGVAVDEHVRQLIRSLPPDSGWREILRHAWGDGVRQPWMDDMRTEGIKLAAFTFEFTWIKGGRDLRDWRLAEQQYFRDFDRSQPVTDPHELDVIKASGLVRRLEDVALARAKQGNWVDYPREDKGTGYRQVLLAENEWLPVGLSPFFGQYEPGTTPLMHAALLGDVAGIKRLLSQGASIDAVSPDGSTALIYAAASDNPAAVDCLLKAGANVNANMKGGGNALTAAVVTDHSQNVALLLKAGLDPNAKTVEGESVLSFAIRRHYADIVKLLRRTGARE